MFIKPGLFVLAAFVCTGCANLTTYNKERAVSESSKIFFIDAKQRAVIANTHTTPATTGRDGVTKAEEKFQQFCAEPSPDALSAIAASLGVNLSVPGQGDLGVNSAITETAVNIGIRTSAIQALRDITYRNCEGYVNGGITSFGLETLQRRFQSTLVATLAIEQLTGAFQAKNVALTSAISKSDAASLAKITDQVSDAKTALDTASSEQTKAEKKTQTAKDALAALNKQKDDDAPKIAAILKKKEADRSKDEIAAIAANDELISKQIPLAEKAAKTAASEQDIKTAITQARQGDYDASLKIRSLATEGGGSLATAALFAPSDTPKPVDKETAIAVSAAVTQIVDSTLRLGFGREACTTLFGQLVANGTSNIKGATDSFEGTCINYLAGDASLLQNQADQIKAQTDSLKAWMPIIQKLATEGKLTSDQALQYFTVMFGLPGVPGKDDASSREVLLSPLPASPGTSPGIMAHKLPISILKNRPGMGSREVIPR